MVGILEDLAHLVGGADVRERRAEQRQELHVVESRCGSSRARPRSASGKSRGAGRRDFSVTVTYAVLQTP